MNGQKASGVMCHVEHENPNFINLVKYINES